MGRYVAIDGKNETAWGIDAGPGLRIRIARPCFAWNSRSGCSGGELTLQLMQNHGGWNSDDHQNNLLGRFRISVTSARQCHCRSAAAATRVPRSSASRASATRERPRSFAIGEHDRAEFLAANEQIDALWRQWPAGTTALWC